MNEEKNFNKIAKYLSDNADPKEREALFSWVESAPDNKMLLEDGMELWEAAEQSGPGFETDIHAAWDKMEQRINQARNPEDNSRHNQSVFLLQPWMKFAAAALILFGLTWWVFQSQPSVEWTEKGTLAMEKTAVDLPDGSKVWLNQNSTIKYEKFFDKRVVFLEGEAFFDVVKSENKPFIIFAGNSKTSVLGTSFNVRAYPDEKKVEVVVESGKVAFEAENQPSENTLLTANEYATFTKNNEKIEKQTGTKLNAAAWKKGQLRFQNPSMIEVIESLERYYDIKISVDNQAIYNCTWNNTKTFEKPLLTDLLDLIQFTTPIQVNKNQSNQYEFSGEGCNNSQDTEIN